MVVEYLWSVVLVIPVPRTTHPIIVEDILYSFTIRLVYEKGPNISLDDWLVGLVNNYIIS